MGDGKKGICWEGWGQDGEGREGGRGARGGGERWEEGMQVELEQNREADGEEGYGLGGWRRWHWQTEQLRLLGGGDLLGAGLEREGGRIGTGAGQGGWWEGGIGTGCVQGGWWGGGLEGTAAEQRSRYKNS